MQTWFRLAADGRIVGRTHQAESQARANLRPGETLVPAEPGVDPRRHRRDLTADCWIEAEQTAPAPDPRFLRRTGYPDTGDQLGALMKITARLLAGERPTDAERAEFAAIAAEIARIKAAHPIG